MKFRISYNSMYDPYENDYVIVEAPRGDYPALVRAIFESGIGDYIDMDDYNSLDKDEREYYAPVPGEDFALTEESIWVEVVPPNTELGYLDDPSQMRTKRYVPATQRRVH